MSIDMYIHIESKRTWWFKPALWFGSWLVVFGLISPRALTKFVAFRAIKYRTIDSNGSPTGPWRRPRTDLVDTYRRSMDV